MNLVIAPAALSELRDAAAFYTLHANAALGLQFVAEFERAAQLMLNNPQIGSVFRGRRRRFILRRFPYGLVYQVLGDDLVILAVAHHRRRPGYWSGRTVGT